MASETPRFRLTTFDNASDEITHAGWKFTGHDRRLLDQLLVQAEKHRHAGITIDPATDTKPDAPVVSLNPTGGVFPANTTVHYRTAVVSDGQEQVGSQIATVTTPAPMAIPAPPTLSSASGALTAGDWIYVLTAYYPSTEAETLGSRATSERLSAAGGFLLTMPTLPSGATGFNVYRQGPTDSSPRFVASVSVDDATWTDDGSITADTYRTVPTTNTSAGQASIDVTGPTLSAGETLKVYRTTSLGNWQDSLLTHTTSTTFTDTGHGTGVGTPLEAAAAVGGPPKIDLGTEATGSPPPGLLTTTHHISFVIEGPVVEGAADVHWVPECVPPGYWGYLPSDPYYWHVAGTELVSVRAALGRSSELPDTTLEVGFERGPSWTPVGVSGGYTTATIPNTGLIGSATDLTGVDDPVLEAGESLRVNVIDDGFNDIGAAPSNLVVVLTVRVRHGSTVASYVWETA